MRCASHVVLVEAERVRRVVEGQREVTCEEERIFDDGDKDNVKEDDLAHRRRLARMAAALSRVRRRK